MKIFAATPQRHSEIPDDLDLFTPSCVALARRKIITAMEQRSQFDCAVTLFRLWRDRKE